jgi:hypothetical protein
MLLIKRTQSDVLSCTKHQDERRTAPHYHQSASSTTAFHEAGWQSADPQAL